MSFFKAKRDADPVVNLINDGIGFFVGIGLLIGAAAMGVVGLIIFAVLKMTGVI